MQLGTSCDARQGLLPKGFRRFWVSITLTHLLLLLGSHRFTLSWQLLLLVTWRSTKLTSRVLTVTASLLQKKSSICVSPLAPQPLSHKAKSAASAKHSMVLSKADNAGIKSWSKFLSETLVSRSAKWMRPCL